MEILHALAAVQARGLMNRQFGTPEQWHLAEVLAARDPWRQRFVRHLRRIKLLASQPSQTAAAGSY